MVIEGVAVETSPLFETTPQEINQEIQRFCNVVVAGGVPAFVPVEPVYGAEVSRCHVNVADHVRAQGGVPVFGWIIWQSRVMLHAEAHCNWLSPQGQLIDITPKADREPKVLFLADTGMTWDGRVIASRRAARIDDPTIRQLIQVHDEIGELRSSDRPWERNPFLADIRFASLRLVAARLTSDVERLVGVGPRHSRTAERGRAKKKAERKAKRRQRKS